eukprot:CAMPEP_0172170198 /NCGR_PEP_ID=MMETSP1050-20130122/11130_1 /TAXON_ID=233186 /ORGANISM="Cryptomonas curvata, Strain CCAP979/52" /LENGTH=205 /DNA_ID=CAMNT_0012841345 /DNA_START=81 /DNA_END=695 /DNA_ORIENTATION=+
MSAYFNPMQAKASLDIPAMKWHADTFQSILSSHNTLRPGISAASWVSKSSSLGSSFLTHNHPDSSRASTSNTIKEYTANRPATTNSAKTVEQSENYDPAASRDDRSDGSRRIQHTSAPCENSRVPNEPSSSHIRSTHPKDIHPGAIPGQQHYALSRTLFTSYQQVTARTDAQLADISHALVLHYERAVPLLLRGGSQSVRDEDGA